MDLLKWLFSWIPEDPETKAGIGPLKLPESAAWMETVFKYHDYYYVIGPAQSMRLSDIDWRIFKALTVAAEEVEDPMERCHRASDICLYWPLMRKFGHYLYARHAKGNEDESKPN